jgi:hypothetical protein
MGIEMAHSAVTRARSSHFAAVCSNVNETSRDSEFVKPFVFINSFIQSSLARNANVMPGA